MRKVGFSYHKIYILLYKYNVMVSIVILFYILYQPFSCQIPENTKRLFLEEIVKKLKGSNSLKVVCSYHYSHYLQVFVPFI